MGNVFSRIVATQFRLLKRGDSFFYENGGRKGFTPGEAKVAHPTVVSLYLILYINYKLIFIINSLYL